MSVDSVMDMNKTHATDKSGYGRILKSSSIIASSQAVNYIVSLARTKVAAVLLGTSGVGIVGAYVPLVTLITSFSTGLSSSGVREIARANSSGNPVESAKTIQTLQRACWIAGLVGWLVTAGLAWPISVWMFGNPLQAWSITLLGAAVFLTALSGGKVSIVQGMRRMGALAKITIGSAVIGTVVVITIYFRAGEAGIVPAIVAAAAVRLLVSSWFSKQIYLPNVEQSWRESLRAGRALLSVGGAMMWGGAVVALADMGIRSILIRQLGFGDLGVYQAAWSISGMFAGFILSAMGADFLPGLSEKIDDNGAANQMVNQQTEIGVLLALPGLVGSFLFAPFLILFFFTKDFSESAQLLPWIVVGVFGRVIGWPMGFLLIAKGASRWFVFTQTQFALLQVVLVYVLVRQMGLLGVAVAFPVVIGVGLLLNLIISYKLTKFCWSAEVMRLIGVSTCFVGSALVVKTVFAGWFFIFAALGILAASASYCLRGLSRRLGSNHRLIRLALRVPVLRTICEI